jgi:hypothetical protein
MDILLFFIGLFFLFILFYSFATYFATLKEGLTPFDLENKNTLAPISLTDLEKEVEDISGNVANLKKQVDQIIVTQGDYFSKNPPPAPKISLAAVS